jgi:hypothetical protein
MIDVAGLILALMWLTLGGLAVYRLGGRALHSRRAAAALVATFLVAFVAGYMAHRRGTPAGVPPPPQAVIDVREIDALSFSTIPAPGSVDTVTRSAHGAYELSGWIGDPVRLGPGSGVFVLLDGKVRAAAPARYGLDRPDVARAFANANLLWSGFELVFQPAPDRVASGLHYLQVILVSSDRQRAYVLPRRIALSP